MSLVGKMFTSGSLIFKQQELYFAYQIGVGLLYLGT